MSPLHQYLLGKQSFWNWDLFPIFCSFLSSVLSQKIYQANIISRVFQSLLSALGTLELIRCHSRSVCLEHLPWCSNWWVVFVIRFALAHTLYILWQQRHTFGVKVFTRLTVMSGWWCIPQMLLYVHCQYNIRLYCFLKTKQKSSIWIHSLKCFTFWNSPFMLLNVPAGDSLHFKVQYLLRWCSLIKAPYCFHYFIMTPILP